MPPNHLVPAWTEAEEAFVRANPMPHHLLAQAINAQFHGNQPVRSRTAVRFKRQALGIPAPSRAKKVVNIPAGAEQRVEVSEDAEGREARSNSPSIRTVEDLLRHIDADMTRFEIAASEATKYETTVRTEDGPRVQEMFRVFVRLRPKVAAFDVRDAVQSIVKGAFASRKALPKPSALPTAGILQALIIADPHIGKHAWGKETGHGDYDLAIACNTLATACASLMTEKDVAVRHFFLVGDIYHYDTPTGLTTKGTPLERDGRVQKMIQMGAETLCDILEASAKEVPTEVTLVPGNHDTVLTWALQQVLLSHFRHTKGIRIDPGYEVRKYRKWGKTLLGLTHGDKGHKLLPSLMAREAALEWGQTTYREIHRGHLHFRRAVDTVEGVTIRQHPALCPPDAWHAAEGFVSDRGMEAHLYHSEGAWLGGRCYAPDLGQPVRSGTRRNAA